MTIGFQSFLGINPTHWGSGDQTFKSPFNHEVSMFKFLKIIGSTPSSTSPEALTSPIETEQYADLKSSILAPIPSPPNATPEQTEPTTSHSYYVQDQEPEWLSPDPPFTID
jgi:hypothetical protein